MATPTTSHLLKIKMKPEVLELFTEKEDQLEALGVIFLNIFLATFFLILICTIVSVILTIISCVLKCTKLGRDQDYNLEEDMELQHTIL